MWDVGGNSRGSPSAISMAVIPRDHWSLYWDIMEGRGGEGKVINDSSSEPIPTAYPVVICGRRVLVTRYHLGSHPGVEKGYTCAQQVGWREGGGSTDQ